MVQYSSEPEYYENQFVPNTILFCILITYVCLMAIQHCDCLAHYLQLNNSLPEVKYAIPNVELSPVQNQ